jgi:TrbC/VIRB2 pilin
MRAHLTKLAKAGTLTLMLGASSASLSALRTAAGGTSGSNGFADVAKFLDNIATYLIYLAIPGGALGLIAAGGMLISGSPDGPKWLARTGIGVGIVLLAKGIMA